MENEPKIEKPRTADYLAFGKVIMNKLFYNNPQKMRDFFQQYVESIEQEGIQEDPEKFAKGKLDGYLSDYESSIKEWRKILAEKNSEAEK